MSVTYKVVAPLVLVTDAEGHTHHAYQGAVIEELGKEQAEHLLAEGLIAKEKDAPPVVPGTEFISGTDFTAVDEPAPVKVVEVPARVATKDAWVDFAVSKGADRSEAEALTKAELQELYG